MSAQPRFSPPMQTALADCPLARMYGWRPPIQDWNPRTEPLASAPPRVVEVVKLVRTDTVIGAGRTRRRYGEEKWAEFFRRYDELKAHYTALGFKRMGGKAVKKLCAELDINYGSARTVVTMRSATRKFNGVA